MTFIQIPTSDITTKPSTISPTYGIGMTEDVSDNLIVGGIHNLGDSSRLDIWQYTGSSWVQIDTTSINAVTIPDNDAGVGLTVDGSDGLVVVTLHRLTSTSSRIDVWQQTGASWTQIDTTSINATTIPEDNTEVSITTDVSDNLVVAALHRTGTFGDVDVWIHNGGASWTQIDTSGITTITNRSAGIEIVACASGDLVVATIEDLTGDLGRVDAWRYSGGSWTQINTSDINAGTSVHSQAGISLAKDIGDNLYLATLHDLGLTGRIDIWALSGSSWEQINTSDITTLPDDAASLSIIASCANNLTVASWDRGDACIDVWQESTILQSCK